MRDYNAIRDIQSEINASVSRIFDVGYSQGYKDGIESGTSWIWDEIEKWYKMPNSCLSWQQYEILKDIFKRYCPGFGAKMEVDG